MGRNCDVYKAPLNCLTTKDGHDYTAFKNRTESGKQCQYWSTTSPQSHSCNPEEPGNYCRNLWGSGECSSKAAPWCFTTNHKKRWEYCKIPFCKGKGKFATNFRYTYFEIKTLLSSDVVN
ncbi:hypothetical protein NP493_959g01081 [Ridgeia piscesae]|uniref:Kringle domain-containing protein n=1 Tax=Ridgeia piscesae TaxID=27915 RepID=A0AAD9KKQ0_RIDPI|nr:hypothetical protein NP493_959g01081 [Ridgeia piscesae]